MTRIVEIGLLASIGLGTISIIWLGWLAVVVLSAIVLFGLMALLPLVEPQKQAERHEAYVQAPLAFGD